MLSLSQASLALAILTSACASFLVMLPPNPTPQPSTSQNSTLPSTPDLLRDWGLGRPNASVIIFAPPVLLALYTALLALTYPKIPPYLLRHGPANGLNEKLITWSASTAIPLALLLLVAVPLRAAAYWSLGSNFTYTLTTPDGLRTEGVYAWIQHPGYTSFFVLCVSLLWLFFRTDGAQSTWFRPGVYARVRVLEKVVVLPVVMGLLGYAIWGRVVQEEQMLEGLFGGEWRGWSGRTKRFVPGVF
ncbi:hypothetical protein QBC34DRAFT_444022 [Podospora aff. communis PSN243]|uniref:Protein-S-isoprenylcysteine O-methyltransferase n=1 Tax=Podospora aff. communis PSN243 TaxID=3040156 RepID=A0AAV9G3G8_9PEZI|nr:hypothetical protein QBC34DRAFT_444022 [Podospora aff. communis PSN243]